MFNFYCNSLTTVCPDQTMSSIRPKVNTPRWPLFSAYHVRCANRQFRSTSAVFVTIKHARYARLKHPCRIMEFSCSQIYLICCKKCIPLSYFRNKSNVFNPWPHCYLWNKDHHEHMIFLVVYCQFNNTCTLVR